jgi:hypothetical protein
MKITLNILVSKCKWGSSYSGIVSIQAIVKTTINLCFLFVTGTFKTAQCIRLSTRTLQYPVRKAVLCVQFCWYEECI